MRLIHLCTRWTCPSGWDEGAPTRLYYHGWPRRFYIGWFEWGWLDDR